MTSSAHVVAWSLLVLIGCPAHLGDVCGGSPCDWPLQVATLGHSPALPRVARADQRCKLLAGGSLFGMCVHARFAVTCGVPM
eukprot:4600887-Alexandrium_andersonii.AAC.1